jgi:hypothetical protein
VTAAAAPTNEENGAGDANADNNHNLKVDFGLVQYSLGNRVWLDNGAGTGGVANDGILNGTEAGISGVSVSLFADADCNQAIDNTASPLATVTTDTNGYYRFDALKAVCYIVRVNPANFLSGGVLAGRISSAGNVNAGSNSTDSRDNGIDPASHGTTGVLSNTINIGSKTMPLGETNPGGGYGPGATNGPAASDNSDDLTVDFGFRIAGPTAVELADFSAVSDGQTALLSWRSGSEKDNLGYNVYRRIGDQGEPVRLTAEPLAGSAFKVKSGTTLTAGDSYYYRDSFVAGAEYYLEAVGLDGRKQRFGPVFVKQDKQAAAALARAPQARSLGQLAAARENTPTKVLPPKALRASLDREPVVDALAQQRRLAADAHALRLGIRETGWYRVNGAQLRAAGLDPATDAEMLQLYADGEQLPMLVRTQAGAERGPLGEQGVIEFYAFGLDERETDTRVYWLAAGATPGLRFGAPGRAAGGNSQSADGSKQAADGGNQAAPVSFPVTAERKERAIYFSALTNGEDDENFFGAPVLRNPSSQNLELAHPDVNANGPARLEVSLQAATSGAHRVRVQFNGQEVGFLEWNGQAKHSQRFNVPAGILRAGANSVTLNAEADGDISLTDFLRLVYNRRYEAGNNTLLFTANARQRAEVTGFTTPDVRLFDLTDPRRAFAVAARMESNAGGYTLRVPAGANNRALLALGAANAFSPAFIVANDASSWNAPENGADLLIIAPAAFRQPAKTLAQTRSAQGLRAFAVNLEDIFDEYSGGAKRLAALRAFLRDARENWKTPPRYVLFLGDASYDPRNYLQMGAHDLVPTGWVATSYLETSSDESIVDFDGDGVGELALGRLPARTVGQAQLLVEKTLGYQPRPLAQGGALFIADQPDGYNFAQMNQDAAAVLPAGIPNRQWVRGTEPDPQFRQAILGALNQGPALVHYAGHGSVETWTGAGLLQTPDAGQFSNAQLSVYVMLTCLNGYFADETTESLAEGLLKAPNGGAAAVWASTGLTAAPGQQAAAREFYRRAFAATQTARLGDAAQAAKRATSDPEVRSTWTLFADPTLTLR